MSIADKEINRIATYTGACKMIGASVVFIGNDELASNVGKITQANEDLECFFIRLNNDNSIYQIPFDKLMCHKAQEFQEWILESVYDEIAPSYGLPPVPELVLLDQQQREKTKKQRQEKIKMQEEKKAAKEAKEEAKKAKAAAKEEAKKNADPFVLVVCKKNAETGKAEYGRTPVKSATALISTVKTLVATQGVTSVQILVK